MRPLSKNEVLNKRKTFGSNEITEQEKNKLLLFFKEIISEPMFILLIACSFIYTLIGDKLEGIILIFSVIIIILITFFQHQRSEKALKALKKLSSPFATVLREDGVIKINSKEIVIDDVLLLFEGDYVSADAIILETEYLLVNESALTGESFPVLKSSIAENKNNYVYSGSFIVQGNANAMVTAIGNDTQIGKTGKSLSTINQENSRLQKEMKVLVRNLFIAGIFLSTIVIIVFYITKGNLLYATLTGLSSAMAILPEEFPVVLTVFLTMGAWKLAKINVLIRNPASVENLGATTFLCTDKTGTITENKMEIAICSVNDLVINKADFKINITTLNELFYAAYFACPEFTNDPIDKAIKEIHMGLFQNKNKKTLIKEFLFNKDALSVTRVIKNETSVAYAKGAPEKIIDRCNLSDFEKQKHIETLNALSKKGLRIIGIAKSNNVDENKIPPKQEDFKLDFLGWIAFEDPIREGIKDAVLLCKSAGIKVILITGDYKETAIEICKQAGIYSNGKNYSGDELDELSDNELQKNIQETELFYRVKPLQKLRIVNALKNKQEIVCMTGDGINDAPALKAADIGVAMGLKGTSVAKEASSIILLDDNFNSIVNGIRTGRKIYINIKHAFSYIISIHVPIVGLAILPAFVSDFPVILMPVHIVLLELMIDPISSITFEKFEEDLNLMQRPPRSLNEKFFNKSQWIKSSVEGLILFAILFFVLLISRAYNQNDEQQRTIVLITFDLGNLLLVTNKLEKSKKNITKNNSIKTVFITSIIILGVLSVIIFIPLLRILFRLELFDNNLWFMVFVFLFVFVLTLSAIKRVNKLN